MNTAKAIVIASAVLLLSACGAPLTGKYQGSELGGGYSYGGQQNNQFTMTLVQDGDQVKGQWYNSYQKGDISGTVDGDFITGVVLTENLSYQGGTTGGNYQTCGGNFQGMLNHIDGKITGTLMPATSEGCQSYGAQKTLDLNKVE